MMEEQVSKKSGEYSLTVRKEYENGHSATTTLWLIGCRRE